MERNREFELVRYPAEILTTPAEEMSFIDFDFLRRLYDFCEEINAFGIAATQVGVNARAFVANIEGSLKCIVNPHILKRGDKTEVMAEGCFSLPGLLVPVERPTDVLVSCKFVDVKGQSVQEREYKFFNMDARVFQHEYDHIDGKTLFDHLKPLRRKLYMKKYAKHRKLTKQLEARG